MKKIVLLFLVLVMAGCNKPSEGDCRKAVQRIRELQGTANIEGMGDMESAVRSCRGNASKESVKCAMEASSLEALMGCGILSKEEMEEIKAEENAAKGRDQK